MFNIGEAAKKAGVSKRTLHYYDSIGLFKPGYIAENSYRYYTEEDMDKLQRITLFRSMGMPISEIKRVINSPDVCEEDILLKQLDLLKERAAHTIKLIGLTKICLKRIAKRKHISEKI